MHGIPFVTYRLAACFAEMRISKYCFMRQTSETNLREEVRDHHSWYCKTEASTPRGTESGLLLLTHRQTAWSARSSTLPPLQPLGKYQTRSSTEAFCLRVQGKVQVNNARFAPGMQKPIPTAAARRKNSALGIPSNAVDLLLVAHKA